MKKTVKGIIIGFIIASFIMTCVPNTAVGINKTIDAVLNSISIKVNGQVVNADNILYNGTTYVPLRAISEILNKDVVWDGNTNTASINDKIVSTSQPTATPTPKIQQPTPTPIPTPTLTPVPTPTHTPEPTKSPVSVVTPKPKVETQPSDNKEVTVYITKTGEKYHTSGCRYLSRSKISIDLSDAKSQGYTPCSVCNPPR